MQTDFLQYIFQAINNLLTQNLGFFDAMGQNLFRMFATILIVWYGAKSALSAASGKQPFQFDNFASLLLTISFGFAMVNYYSMPIPGVGTSFHNLITDEAQFLSSRIDQAQLQNVVAQIADFQSRMDSPGWGDFLGTAIYVVVIILLSTARPSRLSLSPTALSPPPYVSSLARSLFRSSSFQKWNGSSGVGFAALSSMPSTRLSPRLSCT